MKKIYTLLAAVSFSCALTAQTANAVVFTELGEKFTLYLNGEQQNAAPQSNVKVNGLTGEFYQARIDFEDAKLADFAENNFRVAKGVEVTYMVKVNKKGAYVLRYAGESPIAGTTAATTPASNEESKRIADVDNESGESATVKTTGNTGSGEVTVVETTTTTTASPTTNTTGKTGEKVSVGMNIGGVNMGVNMTVEGDDAMDMEMEESSTVTTTTRTTTSSSTTTSTAPAERKDVVVTTAVSGCSKAMTDASFASAKKNIADKGFDETRLSTAKSIVKSNCMTAAQIKDICDTFGFEETKLDFAKYAYDYCYDQNNYFVVNETFAFSDSTEELNSYIDSK